MSTVTVKRPPAPAVVTIELNEQEARDLLLVVRHIRGTSEPLIPGDPYRGTIRETTDKLSYGLSRAGVEPSGNDRAKGIYSTLGKR